MTVIPYSFRRASGADLPRLKRWLRTPEAARWWGNPRLEFETLCADLAEPRMTMLIVALRGRPFAYAQHYEVHAWPQAHLAHLPQGARAIDSFIGWPSMIGRGHGQAYLRLLAEQLLAEGAPLVAIDPDAANLRARRAYEKAGFRPAGSAAAEPGQAVLMLYGHDASVRLESAPR
jgi:aminoglycoside 6'-N-acetyltransferase